MEIEILIGVIEKLIMLVVSLEERVSKLEPKPLPQVSLRGSIINELKELFDQRNKIDK